MLFTSYLKYIFFIEMGFTFYFYLRMENLSQEVRNGISILKKNIRFESVVNIKIRIWGAFGYVIL